MDKIYQHRQLTNECSDQANEVNVYLVLWQVFLGIITVTDNTHTIAISLCRWVVIALQKERFALFVREHCADD